MSTFTMTGNRILDAMIQLARTSPFDRIILAGSNGTQRMRELNRSGYHRVATTASCGLPAGQYGSAFVEWRLPAASALGATLDWLVHFIAPAGVLVLWLDDNGRLDRRRIVPMLERVGFRVEAGTRCGNGLAISARRRETTEGSVAA
jgi:hypothetical protein